MYKNAIKMLRGAIFKRFYQIFGVFIPKNMVLFGFQSGVFFGVLWFPDGVFGPWRSGHTDHNNFDREIFSSIRWKSDKLRISVELRKKITGKT